MNSRRACYGFLIVIALFLVGTVVVLSSVTYLFAIPSDAYILEQDIPQNYTKSSQERIQRIIHQTWKTDTLPLRWQQVSQDCRNMMSDYEYMLWTDAGSREFIAEHYPWFLKTFDNYKYPIQRADAIRYFVLYHYGGVYMDLDIGCRRPIDALLVYPAILPKTIPVGISNDLMFTEKGHPFFKQTIENLENFNYNWLLNYPTVMFSTGPMFLSAQYGLYLKENLAVAVSQVRVLPKSLYGKNVQASEAPKAFFSHYYASSWHADDAPFIAFLNTWGKPMMWLGLFILVIGLFRIFFKSRRGITRIAGYDIVLPSLSRSGRWHVHLVRHLFTFSFPQSATSEPGSPMEEVPFLHIPVDAGPYTGRPSSYIMETFRQVRSRIRTVRDRISLPNSPVTPSGARDVLVFLPAVFTTQPSDIELSSQPPFARTTTSGSRERNRVPPRSEKGDFFRRDVESGGMQTSFENRETIFNWEEYETNPGISPHLRSSGSEDTVVQDSEVGDAWFTS